MNEMATSLRTTTRFGVLSVFTVVPVASSYDQGPEAAEPVPAVSPEPASSFAPEQPVRRRAETATEVTRAARREPRRGIFTLGEPNLTL